MKNKFVYNTGIIKFNNRDLKRIFSRFPATESENFVLFQ